MKYARFLQELGVTQPGNPDGTTAWSLKPPFDALRALLRKPGVQRSALSPKSAAQDSFDDFWAGAPEN